MSSRYAYLALACGAWACADATQPVAPTAAVSRAEAQVGEVDVAVEQPGHRGVAIVEAYIDGRSTLSISGFGSGLLRWEHFDWAAPGRLGGAFLPTRVGRVNWYPDWPDDPDSENRDCHCASSLGSHDLFFWPLDYDVDPRARRARGPVSFSAGGALVNIAYDDNAIPGAEWYSVSLDTRFPLGVQPWPNQTPYIVSLSRQRYVSLALLSYGAGGLDDPAALVDFSLGDERGSEAGIALSPDGLPLLRVADVNADTIDDAIVRFPIAALAYRGDAPLGHTVLKVTAFSPGWGYVRGDLPVTFVP